MIKVSVLMPIYNASEYLQNSLDSVESQTLKEIEIICINDGSTDNSLDIINLNAASDHRIKVLNKKNSGYGDSMNHGLAIANGKYIAILEPDDWYESNFLETVYNKATINNLDVIKTDFWQYCEKERHNKIYNLFKNKPTNVVLSNYESQFVYSLQPSIWSGIYNREFLAENHIKFLPTPGASYQDTSFNFKVFAIAQRVMFLDRPFVHYRIDNNGSSINNIAKKLPFIDQEYDEIDKFIIKHSLSRSFADQSLYCRYLTYLWAIEQLKLLQIVKYLKTIKSHLYTIAHKCRITTYVDTSQTNRMIHHPFIYATRRSVGQRIHMIRSHR